MSPSVTHTLVFALMMLHTDQHNASLKRHRTMDLEQFVNLVRSVEDAEKLEIGTLEQLYASMTRQEMKLCDDDSNMLSGNDRNISLSSWNLLIERARSAADSGYIDCGAVDTVQCHGDVLGVVFSPLLTAFSVIFDVIKQKEEQKEGGQQFIRFFIPISSDELVSKVMAGFYNLALFVHDEADCDKMDLWLLRLCQLSGLHDVGNPKCGLRFRFGLWNLTLWLLP